MYFEYLTTKYKTNINQSIGEIIRGSIYFIYPNMIIFNTFIT